MQFLTILKLIVQLLPLVIQAINAAEAAIPQSGSGAEKLAFVKALFTEVGDVGKEVSEADYGNALEKTIKLVVALFNKTGTFAKK